MSYDALYHPRVHHPPTWQRRRRARGREAQQTDSHNLAIVKRAYSLGRYFPNKWTMQAHTGTDPQSTNSCFRRAYAAGSVPRVFLHTHQRHIEHAHAEVIACARASNERSWLTSWSRIPSCRESTGVWMCRAMTRARSRWWVGGTAFHVRRSVYEQEGAQGMAYAPVVRILCPYATVTCGAGTSQPAVHVSAEFTNAARPGQHQSMDRRGTLHFRQRLNHLYGHDANSKFACLGLRWFYPLFNRSS